MRKLHPGHETWYAGGYETATELMTHLAASVGYFEDQGSITNIDIQSGDALDDWSATITFLPDHCYGE